MAFIIPNAGITGGGLKYAHVNLAEPDSLDFELLGNSPNWVRSGGVCTVSGGAISISSGVVIVAGTPYTFAAPSPITPSSAGSDYRLDAIVVRLSGGTAAIKYLSGVSSSTNPVLPKSRSVLTSDGLYDSNVNVDPATDVYIAVVWKETTTTIAVANVVDKRSVDVRPVTYVGTGVPSHSATKDVIGDTVLYNGVVYYKKNSTTWDSLVMAADQNTGGGPLGFVFAWPHTSDPDVAKYLECNGQAISRTTYSGLFAILSTMYGVGNGSTTFNLPNLNSGRVPIGATTNIGTNVGAAATTLTSSHIPQHNHAVSVATHAAETHTTTNTDTAAAHTHGQAQHGHIGALMYRKRGDHNGHHTEIDAADPHDADVFHIDVYGVNEDDPNDPYTDDEYFDTVEQDSVAGTAVRFRQGTETAVLSGGAHVHSVTIATHAAQAHSVTESNYGTASPTAVPTVPLGINMRWFIRVA